MVNRSLTLPLEAIGNVCRRYGVRELAIFGSALRDEFGVESDVDFLVEFDPQARIGGRGLLPSATFSYTSILP